jgi:aspartate/methionine/tyrosine aminotransferase
MPAEIDPFYAIEINRLAYRLQTEGRSIIHMEYGQPSQGAPKKAIEVAHRILDTDSMGYWESPELKAGLARRYFKLYGLDIDPERFILTCGASAALVLALTVRFAAGDTIATARPGYVAYRNTLKALHLRPHEIACGPDTRYQLSAAHLAALIPPPQGVIVASPANPTGTIIKADELEKIAAYCRVHGIAVVSDEIYHGLSYVEPAETMLRFAPDAFVIGSFSKYFGMPAWRLGWLLAPENHVARARAYVGNLFLTAPSLSQHAATAALDAHDELEARVEVYRHNRDLMLKALPRLGLDKIAPPDGAFYIYANVGHLTDDSLAFCRQLLLDTGVAIAPGIDFDPDAGRRHIRFSFAVTFEETEDAVARLERWFAACKRL